MRLLTSIFGILLLLSCTHNSDKNNTITVQIKYSSDSITTKTIAWHEGLTALESLQFTAEVETHPLGKKYVVVTSINNTKGTRGRTAWYYKINGESPHVVAINKTVNANDTIEWRYVKDHCSASIDSCKR